MSDGVFEQLGPKMDVYSKPASPFIASLVDAANRLAGVLVEANATAGVMEWQGQPLKVHP